MPELPEVERAATALRRALVGRRIARIELHHPALRRRMTPSQRRSLTGARVIAVRRRGKHQLIDLDDGRSLHAHFRMTGDWSVGTDAETARYPRATISLDDGSTIVFDDPRALGTLDLLPRGAEALAGLGPEADDPSLDGSWLSDRLATRKAAIKVALLDQSLMAGIGNIYASEALWRARIDPRREARSLTPVQAARLLRAIRSVLARASGARYAESAGRFDVYDRNGRPCRRCRTPIRRITQAGRSTCYCASCQK